MTQVAGRTCLVTGASGFLGSFLVEHLVDLGARVRCLVRPTSDRQFLPGYATEFALGDVTEPSSLRAALDGVGFVFHVAGLIKAPRPEDYFRVNYLGTINLLEACRQQGAALERVVIVSSLAAAGPSQPGTPNVESALPRPITPYGKSKLRTEEAARAYQRELPITIIRPPTIYGPRDRESLLLFRAIVMGLRPSLPGRCEISVVHASDLADGLILAATHEAGIGQTYYVCDDEIHSIDRLFDQISAALGRRTIAVPVPAWGLRGAARAAELLREARIVSLALDRWKADEVLAGNWACSNDRARAELGFEPKIRIEEGLAETARWYRKAGWL